LHVALIKKLTIDNLITSELLSLLVAEGILKVLRDYLAALIANIKLLLRLMLNKTLQ